MAVDRKKWRDWYYVSDFPRWPCRRCAGTVSLRGSKIADHETADSREDRKHDAWEPEWIRGRFAAVMKCGECEDPTMVTGTWRVEEFWDEDTPSELISRYTIEAVQPAPALIAIPAATPESVREELDRAYALFWTDLDASGNRIRSALERVLDEQRIPKAPSKQNRKDRLTLHSRIERLKVKNAEAAELMMAVKWIGNAASHTRALAREDVMDGLDLLEHVLRLLYSSEESAARKLAKAINRTKKPRARRPRA